MSRVEDVARYMGLQRLTLATAESCTAGLIASLLAEVPGAGQLLECAFVVYSPQAKLHCLGVAPEVLQRHNLTSTAVARAMAMGAAERARAGVFVAAAPACRPARNATPGCCAAKRAAPPRGSSSRPAAFPARATKCAPWRRTTPSRASPAITRCG